MTFNLCEIISFVSKKTSALKAFNYCVMFTLISSTCLRINLMMSISKYMKTLSNVLIANFLLNSRNEICVEIHTSITNIINLIASRLKKKKFIWHFRMKRKPLKNLMKGKRKKESSYISWRSSSSWNFCMSSLLSQICKQY